MNVMQKKRKKDIKTLNKIHPVLYNSIKNLDLAIKTHREYSIKGYVEYIKSLKIKREKLQKQYQACIQKIKKLQKICKHDWVDDGHDSHHFYVKCNICNLVEQE